jgi:hypothetical protein
MDVYTPVVVRTEQPLKGTKTPGDIFTVQIPGGHIGCDTYVLEDARLPKVNDKLALFLDTARDSAGNLRPGLRLIMSWRVNGSGDVVTPNDGTLSPNQMRALVGS